MSSRRHVVLFADEDRLLEALARCRERGIEVVDAHSPWPVHGIDAALGIPRSRLTLVCFFAGLAGLALGLAFQYWTSAADWPLDVGGKPFDSLPAFVPVGFELTVLFGGLATALALLARSRLWPGKRPSRAIEGVTDDRLALVVAERGAEFPPSELADLFRSCGAVGTHTEVVS